MKDIILLAKQDLDSYSEADIAKLSQYYDLSATNRDDLLWLLALKIHTKHQKAPMNPGDAHNVYIQQGQIITVTSKRGKKRFFVLYSETPERDPKKLIRRVSIKIPFPGETLVLDYTGDYVHQTFHPIQLVPQPPLKNCRSDADCGEEMSHCCVHGTAAAGQCRFHPSQCDQTGNMGDPRREDAIVKKIVALPLSDEEREASKELAVLGGQHWALRECAKLKDPCKKGVCPRVGFWAANDLESYFIHALKAPKNFTRANKAILCNLIVLWINKYDLITRPNKLPLEKYLQKQMQNLLENI